MNDQTRYADENGKLLLRDSDDYTPEERKVWGISADHIVNKPLPEKWDRETTLWRLKEHCRALVMEGTSREDVLQYLIDYNRLGSEVPQWFEKYLPDLVSWYEPIFKEHDREGKRIKLASPMSEEELTEHAFIYPIASRGEGYEGLFPRGEVSLLGGSSGGGKTTWLVPILEDIRQEKPVLGRATHSMDYRVLMHDRSFGAFLRTSRRMNLCEWTRESTYRLSRAEQRMPAPEFLQSYMDREEQEDVGILFIEGLDMWVPAGKVADFQVVCDFMDDLQRIAERNHISIIGSVGNPKMKKGEHYELHRDRLFGSVAWARKAETIIGIQTADKDLTSTVRELTVLNRNGRNEVYYLDFKGGRMVEIEKPSHLMEEPREIPLTKKVRALEAIRGMDNGTVLSRTILGLGEGGYAEAMHSAVQQHLVRKERGRYIVTGGRIPTY